MPKHQHSEQLTTAANPQSNLQLLQLKTKSQKIVSLIPFSLSLLELSSECCYSFLGEYWFFLSVWLVCPLLGSLVCPLFWPSSPPPFLLLSTWLVFWVKEVTAWHDCEFGEDFQCHFRPVSFFIAWLSQLSRLLAEKQVFIVLLAMLFMEEGNLRDWQFVN